METMRAPMFRALIALALASLFGLGCARQGVPVASAPPSSYPNATYGWPPPSIGPALIEPAPAPLVAGPGAPENEEPGEPATILPQPASAPRTVPPVPSMAAHEIPSGTTCLSALDAAGISYKRVEEKRGVETPIEVTGPLGGVRYSGAGQHLVCDCRFALALHKVGPILRELGVETLYFSGAYSYRTSRVGKLSLHAYGLALDVHEFSVKGQRLNVRDHFTRGLGDACAPEAPSLNQVACRLKATGLFRELLTPDYNADHSDHIHIGLAPNTNERSSSPPETPVRTAARAAKPASKSTAAKSPAHAKSSVKIPQLEPVDPARDEPVVIPASSEKPKARAEKADTRDKLRKSQNPAKKRRANARAKSVPERSGGKTRSQDFRHRV